MQALIDPFLRPIRYLRLSVTDRCDFRCTYCMSEVMRFLPRAELLTLEELDQLASAFIRLGVRKLRLTGGEPLVRKDILTLFRSLARHLESGALDELTLTTNGSQLSRYAADLAALGVRRVNVSLDTLRDDRFRALTRGADLAQVQAGIAAAKAAGLQVKINAVALKGVNDDEIDDLLRYTASEGFGLTFIEVMPMGEMEEAQRRAQFWPLAALEADLAARYRLTPLSERTGGPARYMRIEETGQKIGFITPLSHNFCESCNRVRVTCKGELYLCLGQEDRADLRAVMRAEGASAATLEAALRAAIARKPKGHDFDYGRLAAGAKQTAPIQGQMPRHMSHTGG